MSDDEITARIVPLGSLAGELVAVQAMHIRVGHEMETLLDSLFPDGWLNYEHHDFRLDVYGVHSAPAAIAALQRAGFTTIHLHDHRVSEFTRCACRARGAT